MCHLFIAESNRASILEMEEHLSGRDIDLSILNEFISKEEKYKIPFGG
jgi:hypothetical protein